ncbi:MAG: hypothetical protein M3162_08330 [Thermoproteota archaeon]|nr:hypothetical protein [Thermoproteota archaeon]
MEDQDKNKDKNKEKGKHDDYDHHGENIFHIMDGIIDQLNKTKKLFIMMIITIMIIPPIAFAFTFIIFGHPFNYADRNEVDNGDGKEGWWSSSERTNGFGLFRFMPLVPIVIVLAWLGIGIRQWVVLSKWDKRYKRYKKLQEQVDKKLEDGTKDD